MNEENCNGLDREGKITKQDNCSEVAEQVLHSLQQIVTRLFKKYKSSERQKALWAGRSR